MKQILFLCAFLSAGTANAACFVEYKAKKDDPLQLHYGIMSVEGECTINDVAPIVSQRLGADGWITLIIQSANKTEPSQTQKDTAGDFYLRY